MHTISDTVTRKFVDTVDISNLEIETDTGWHPISKIMKTIPYQLWVLKTAVGLSLECADEHIVFDSDFKEIFVKDIIPGTYIQTVNGTDKVIAWIVSITVRWIFAPSNGMPRRPLKHLFTR